MRFRATWPIEDSELKFDILRREALADLPDVLRPHALTVRDLTCVRWSSEGGHLCVIACVTTGLGWCECDRLDEPLVRRGLIWRAA